MTAGEIDPARFVFIGGLHRSGTTVLGRVLADHPEASGLTGTGVTEDEGQHLQDVYRPALDFGGPGKFARKERAHLTAPPPSEARQARERLISAWAPHWDLSRPYLVEKSPPNLVMGQFLQAVFPGSALLVIIRHPIVVALSTKKWTRTTSLYGLVSHWFVAHDRFLADAATLRRVHVIRYEDLVLLPEDTLGQVQRFIGLHSPLGTERLDGGRSDSYTRRWDELAGANAFRRWERRRIIEDFGPRMRSFGYAPDDLTSVGPWSIELGSAST